MLPATSSHYSRAKSPSRKYLNPDLTVRRLNDLYISFMTKEHHDVDKVSFSYYSEVFRSEFNIGFSPPSTDTCDTCDLLSVNIRNFKEAGDMQQQVAEVQTVLDEHKLIAKEAREDMRRYKSNEDENVMALCFDLQQTMPTPKLSTGVAYYKRKLWTYNFAIHNLKTNKPTMYVWDEVTARRDSVEIASCLNHCIEENHEESQTSLVLFSDNCPGQNKNVNMTLLCLRLLHSKRFFRIEHKFLVPGHSFMPCDRHFGNIEARLRRENVIATKWDYIDLIKLCVEGGFPVVAMQRADFLDYDVLQTYLTKRTAPGGAFKDARILVFDSSFREGYAIKADFNTEDAAMVRVRLMKGKGRFSAKLFDLSAVAIPSKYDGAIPLSNEKLEDIIDLIKYIAPIESTVYFKDIIQVQQSGQVDSKLLKDIKRGAAGRPRSVEVDLLDNAQDYV